MTHIQTKLHFQRFEFKYLISKEIEAKVKQRIAPFMALDPFATTLKGNMYEVVSLYYDSPGLYYYHQKIDGVKKRKKVRLRTYRNNGKYINYSFFEFKRKYDAIILKDRFVLDSQDYEQLLKENNFYKTPAFHDQHKRNIIEEFEWERCLRSISPRLLVIYDREPYLSKFNKNIRITFDKNIRAKESNYLFYDGQDMVDISGDQTVMEIKFTGTLPFYIHEIISEFGLSRQAYSKYCGGVETCILSSFRGARLPADVKNIFYLTKERSHLMDEDFHIL